MPAQLTKPVPSTPYVYEKRETISAPWFDMSEEDQEHVMFLITLKLQSDIGNKTTGNQAFDDRYSSMIFNYIFTGEWPTGPPFNVYNLKCSMNLYRVANETVRELMEPILASWKQSVFGREKTLEELGLR